MKDEEEDVPYVPSDSAEEFSDTEKILLEKVRQEVNSDSDESEEEVYGLPSNGSTDGEDEEMCESDIEGQGDDSDDLPNVRAWGQKRRNFYNTDYVDQDYEGFNEKDVEAAECEEEEAKVIQKRLVEQLDEGDFLLDMFSKESLQKDRNVEEEEEIIKTDLSKLSKKQKLALFQKESPEFFGLVEDFKVHMTEIQQKIEPVLTLIEKGKIPASSADIYVQTKYHLVLNYCVNIAFYLLLKAKRIAVQSHPVVHRLYQYRQLLRQLKPVDKEMTSQLEGILTVVRDGDEITPSARDNTNHGGKTKAPVKKALKFLSSLREETKNNDDRLTKLPTRLTVVSKTGVTADTRGADLHSKDSSGESELEKDKAVEEEEKEEGKRGITYQIAKNKGLTPHRKKEQRNPRVKHRNKYRKARICRKGQVREPRKEMEKYGGEISGIKSGVVKSIKLK